MNNKKDVQRAWRSKNKEKIQAYAREWRKNNHDKIITQQRKRFSKKCEFIREQRKAWRLENRIRVRESNKKYYNENKDDPKFKIPRIIRSIFCNALKKNKEFNKMDYFDYGVQELKTHLQKQFKEGMSWENYGEWQIDHIVPICEFVKLGEPSEFKEAWKLSNLQPLWAFENQIKGNTIGVDVKNAI